MVLSSERKFFNIALSVDNVIFGFEDEDLMVLLIKRGSDPFKNHWALPGDLVHPDEDLDSSAYRVLKELTDLEDVYLQQVQAFGKVDRHPVGRVITVAYYSLVRVHKCKPTAASFATELQWHKVKDLDALPFDHSEILHSSLEKLRRQVRMQPIGFELLGSKFTLTELQSLYEAILGIRLDKRNFRKRILGQNILVQLPEYQTGVAHRPARLYMFDKEKYDQLESGGFVFV